MSKYHSSLVYKYASERKKGEEMLSFEHYLKVRETTVMDVGSGLMGNTSLDSESSALLTGTLKAARVAFSQQPQRLLTFLKSLGIQEINDILDQANSDDLNKSSFASAIKKVARKGLKPNSDDDVMAPSFSDSASSELP